MQRLIYIIILFLSGFLVLASLLWPVTVDNQADLEAVKFGLPIPFVTQAQKVVPSFPWQTHLISLWENPAQANLLVFLLDVGIVFGTLSLILNLGQMVLRWSHRR